MINWFIKGGIFMWPILLCSIWALGLAIERYWFYTSVRKKIEKQAKAAFKNSAEKNTREASLLLSNETDVMSDILKAAWDKEHTSVSVAERSIEEVLNHHKPELEKYLSTLALFTSIQPLLGLLGTISGMIASFNVISSLGMGNPQAMASGIAEAMITTEAGLTCAIPTLLAHNFLRGKLKNILTLLQKYSARSLKELEKENIKNA